VGGFTKKLIHVDIAFWAAEKEVAEMDCLIIHTPKFNNYYKPFGEFIWVNYMPLGSSSGCGMGKSKILEV
jgi:hypothetical protein